MSSKTSRMMEKIFSLFFLFLCLSMIFSIEKTRSSVVEFNDNSLSQITTLQDETPSYLNTYGNIADLCEGVNISFYGDYFDGFNLFVLAKNAISYSVQSQAILLITDMNGNIVIQKPFL